MLTFADEHKISNHNWPIKETNLKMFFKIHFYYQDLLQRIEIWKTS